MPKYSDHSTIGGQVLAHRIRMIKQNIGIIFLSGKIAFLASYLIFPFTKFKTYEIWNYLCILKADFTKNWPIFNGSYISDCQGNFRHLSDYVVSQFATQTGVTKSFEGFWIHDFYVSIAFATLIMLSMGIIHKKLGKRLTENKEIISGHDFVNAKQLRNIIKNKSDITLADIPYPKNAEMRHTLITGTTGSGKTNVIIELLDQVQMLGDRAIIVDTVGTYINRYYDKKRGDIILNPLDSRSIPWSFLDECKDPEILRNIASCIIEKGGENDRFWEEAAKIVFVETAKKIQAEGKNLKEFIDLLLKAPLAETQKFLENSYGASLVDKDAEKMALSIRAILINSVHIFDILKEDEDNNFSIKNWIYSKQKNFLFLSCSPKERNTIISLITAWLSIASNFLMQSAETNERIWFFIDELHNLKKLPKLDLALAEIRKYGGCFVLGTQLISQLESVYGRELMRSITGLCGTKIVMNVPEPTTAKYMAEFLGEKEEVTSMEALSYGANTIRDGANISQRYSKETVVSGSQIMELTPGEAFIRFSGIPVVGKVKFKLHK